MIDVKIKRVRENALLPTKAHSDDAGWDLYASTKYYDKDGNVVYGTGVAIEVPKGYVGLLFPRSSNAKKDLLLSNSVGVLDSGYRGEILFKFKPSMIFLDNLPTRHRKDMTMVYSLGDRIGQLIIIPYPDINFVEVDELSETERGTDGYGSTGR